MQVTSTEIPGVLIVEPKVFGDARGFFFESFNQKAFDAAVGAPVTFVQDNHSRSAKGVLRGMHLQADPHAQGKLVRVTSGSVFDVAADIDPHSPTYRRWVGVELSADNHRQMWIPAGLAHGFLVLSDRAEVQYKCSNVYNAATEFGIQWDDAELAVAWPLGNEAPVISDRDRKNQSFADFRRKLTA